MARKPREKATDPVASEGGKRASRTPPPDLKVVAGGLGHNSGTPLTDDQRQVLFFQHKRKYESLLATKKKADADLRNACKLAKAECGEHAVKQIKIAIELDDDGGAARLQERLEREAEVARWMGLPIGAQGKLFDMDRRPASEKAFAEGKRAGLAGETAKLPDKFAMSSPEGQEWMRGHAAGQDVHFDKIKDLGSPLLRGAGKPPVQPNPEPEGDDEDGEGEDAEAAALH